MEINMNSNNFGTVGMDFGRLDANAVGAGAETKGAAGVKTRLEMQGAVTFAQAQPVSLTSSEPVGEVPDTALRRDDTLGKLVNAVFNLPPPPMPAFGE